jgi:hypothetical protein
MPPISSRHAIPHPSSSPVSNMAPSSSPFATQNLQSSSTNTASSLTPWLPPAPPPTGSVNTRRMAPHRSEQRSQNVPPGISHPPPGIFPTAVRQGPATSSRNATSSRTQPYGRTSTPRANGRRQYQYVLVLHPEPVSEFSILDQPPILMPLLDLWLC